VRDAQIGQPFPRAEVLQQGRDLGLNGGVETGEGLVQDQEPRLHGQRARDGQPLALPAAQLERPALRLRGGKADHLHQLERAAPPLGAVAAAEDLQRLGDDLGRGQPGRESGRGILEQELHALAERAQRGPAQGRHVGAVEVDLAAGRLFQPARQRASVDLPEPDCPTRATTRPRSIVRSLGPARPRARTRCGRGAGSVWSGRGCAPAARHSWRRPPPSRARIGARERVRADAAAPRTWAGVPPRPALPRTSRGRAGPGQPGAEIGWP
jgi:hypothetical protein